MNMGIGIGRGQRASRFKQRLSVLFRGALALLGSAVSFAGCHDIEPVTPFEEPTTDPTKLYMQLRLDHSAITLDTAAGYKTVQVTATPRDALGNPMSDLPAPTFYSLDTTAVIVTADGVITARAPAHEVSVVATLAVGPVKHADTALVNVTDLGDPPKLASLSIHPVPPDSAVWFGVRRIETNFFLWSEAIGRLATLPTGPSLQLHVLDSNGDMVEGLLTEYTSLDPAIAEVDQWEAASISSTAITLKRSGKVGVVAQTMAYGVSLADTVEFTVMPPLYSDVTTIQLGGGARRFSPSETRIAPFGIVAWTNYLGDSVDVAFETPAAATEPPAAVCGVVAQLAELLGPGPGCASGDMLLPPKGASSPFIDQDDGSGVTVQLRQFLLPGVYNFHSAHTGASGRVIVAPSD